jgi:UDP-3-O-acyl-N-acetylglucosamine deacetylase
MRADYGVRVTCDTIGLDADGVEHLLSAFGGLSVRSGVAIELTGGEMPLLDGAALAFARAIEGLAPPRTAPALRVAHQGVVELGRSSYAFRPGATVALGVEIDFAEEAIGIQRATWGGRRVVLLEDVLGAYVRLSARRPGADAGRSSGGADPPW